MAVTYDDLIRVARITEHELLPTIGGRATFSPRVEGGTLYVVPTSTRKPRQCGAGTRKAIDHYNRTRSLTPSEYQHLTHNSVYILRLIVLAEGYR